jgi:hypothetical protein
MMYDELNYLIRGGYSVIVYGILFTLQGLLSSIAENTKLKIYEISQQPFVVTRNSTIFHPNAL